MNVQTRGASLLAGLAIATSVAYSPQSAEADSMDALLSGKNTPDFTVTYDVVMHNTLQGETRQQIDQQVAACFDKRNQEIIQRGHNPLPEQVEERFVVNVHRDLDYWNDDHQQLTISASGERLLVRIYSKKTSQTFVYLYDGSKSMFGDRRSDFQMNTGLSYQYLRNFVFPGFGVAGIPMAQAVAQQPGVQNAYLGMVAMDDGAAEDGGIPQYRPGVVRTTSVGGRECVSEVQGGDKGAHEQDCIYSDYQAIAPNLMIPGRIALSEASQPDNILPFGPYASIRYSLLKASPKALPARDFTFEGQLQGVNIVQDNTQKQIQAIRYVPGESLDQQFKQAAERQKASAMMETTPAGANKWTGLVGLLALIAGLTGWFVYRRAKDR